MTTIPNETRTKLLKMVAAVLKAHFSKGELIKMSEEGLTLQAVISSGHFDVASIAEGQKMSLALKSRFQIDDVDDFLIMAAASSIGTYVPRSSFGEAGKDGLIAKLFGGMMAKFLEEAKDSAKWVGFVKHDKILKNKLTGRIEEDPTDAQTEYLEPANTFDNPDALGIFVQQFLTEPKS